MTSQAVKGIKAWNDIIGAKFIYLVSTTLFPFLKDVADEFFPTIAEDLAGRIICNLSYWNQMIKNCTASGASKLTCPVSNLDKWDTEYSIDLDTYGTNSDSESTKRYLHILDRRDGAPREFTINCGIVPVTGLKRIMIITSVAYPNGGNGDNLQRANG
ncbi:uncharacterized protein N7503_011410 [Penicillium pulvis]|uniref:uncharacterized protein n=1 Tax=Penicillium pulvis TaxID=1562058 RepID=UPI002546C3B6|nr:uncharacterized protein N7503_011410 [Penicillium pulvis]KAJ5786198.1 hypothetical protein N7503_011410 [Penicillium pulvis]